MVKRRGERGKAHAKMNGNEKYNDLSSSPSRFSYLFIVPNKLSFLPFSSLLNKSFFFCSSSVCQMTINQNWASASATDMATTISIPPPPPFFSPNVRAGCPSGMGPAHHFRLSRRRQCEQLFRRLEGWARLLGIVALLSTGFCQLGYGMGMN